MSIPLIKVMSADGTVIATYGSGRLPFRADPDSSLAMFKQTSTSTVEWKLASDSRGEAIYQEAIEDLSAQGWLKTMNGVESNDGQFSIQGGTCFSWIPGDTEVHTYKERINTTYPPQYAYIIEHRGGGIKLFDMCKACDTCDRIAALRRKLEALKIQVNTLKDMNLYATSRATQRRAYLESNRVAMPAACSSPVPPSSQDNVSGTRLLGQFATCVHMWNFIAAKAHYRTIVETAPQDPAAILVKTSHAYPTCSATQGQTGGTIQCTVAILRTDGASTASTDISVYVPPPTTGFRPFTDSSVTSNMASVTSDASDATHKIITTSFPGVTKAGTYTLGLYVMPFHCAELRDSSNNKLSLENINYNLSPSWLPEMYQPDGISYNTATFGTQATLVNLLKTNPTASEYDTSKSYPSKSDTGMYTWSITVTWSLTGVVGADPSVPSTTVESFVIQARKPRKPVDGLFTTTKLYEVAPQ